MPLLPTALAQTMAVLCAITVALPIGTNLGLLRLLWMQVSGALLPPRTRGRSSRRSKRLG